MVTGARRVIGPSQVLPVQVSLVQE